MWVTIVNLGESDSLTMKFQIMVLDCKLKFFILIAKYEIVPDDANDISVDGLNEKFRFSKLMYFTSDQINFLCEWVTNLTIESLNIKFEFDFAISN